MDEGRTDQLVFFAFDLLFLNGQILPGWRAFFWVKVARVAFWLSAACRQNRIKTQFLLKRAAAGTCGRL
jgi:hypothetical protein